MSNIDRRFRPSDPLEDAKRFAREAEEKKKAQEGFNPYRNYQKKIEEQPPTSVTIMSPVEVVEAPKKIPPKIPAKPVERKAGSRKVSLTVFYSPEVIEFFKATGPGWQPRMNEVLLAHVSSKK